MDKRKITEQAFIRNDQYNFIARQVSHIINAHASVNHKDTLDGVKLHAFSKVEEILPEMNEVQETLLNRLLEIEEEIEAEAFLSELRQYVIPFRRVSKKTVEKLFPKAKKLQVPDIDGMDFKRLSYIGWFDTRAHKQHLIVEYQGKLKGISGVFDNSSTQGICTLCNSLDEVGLFVTRVKSGKETYVNRGNYICKDSQACNEKLTDRRKIETFLDYLFQ
ncbi:FusB/FusC family EF-G-binding protein [Terribacillus sp. AE2B 122]|uniref:FusB/FusC family EF-G-binding protein n=1 Tax=Terribacillus sp. AE2B 122 TaxID=1331902 RepID=UPI001582C4EB|nr:FusB/FusC family EF-G-binding protein [Terribacillus sp. AE2B 122]